MNILLWIIFGGLAGALGSALVGSDLTLPENVVVGIIGAFIGGWLSIKASKGKEKKAMRPTTLWGFIWAVIGSIIFLIIAGFLS